MVASPEQIARQANTKIYELRSRLNAVEGKVVALETAAIRLTDDDITVENANVTYPDSMANVKTKPPGDSDTSDPWTVPDGTADWDPTDPIQ